MKTILIPTDFNAERVKIIDALVLTNKPQNINIIFMHAFGLSDSISDMLMLSRRSKDYENISDDFYTQLEIYRQKYTNHIQSIEIEYFYGNTVAAFKNFIDGVNADCIAYPKDYNFDKINKYSINPKTLTKRCGCEVIELDVHEFSKEEKLFDTKMPQENIKVLSA
ncbi:hypothetical protein EZ428_22625 [Pedobacter frigiditerrae]|uniref:Universal stress protein family protein n=1 Tax=Pedobacter frigiditerrae TaxID=2530452 RepID=A0A4R0MLF2_9SPHI|nr:hypothetical protein [Pedobacter frigiditerrae]TCC87002.1 hypothetical protein EZ428_22625 [Pedobacter frigiditerrae]